MFNGGAFIGIRPFYSRLVDELVLSYIARVNTDGGIIEGLVCLEDKLNALR
jgi:hypothetical protein